MGGDDVPPYTLGSKLLVVCFRNECSLWVADLRTNSITGLGDKVHLTFYVIFLIGMKTEIELGSSPET